MAVKKIFILWEYQNHFKVKKIFILWKYQNNSKVIDTIFRVPRSQKKYALVISFRCTVIY